MKTLNPTLSLLALAALAAGCSSSDAGAQGLAKIEAVAVRTAAVAQTDAAPTIRASGILTAKQELKLSFKAGGLVQRVTVEEGARVAKGQLLATLNKAEIDAQVAQAERGFEKAARDLKRAELLHGKNVATLEQLQDATTAFDLAKAGLDAARFNQQYASIVAPGNGRILERFAEEGEMVPPGAPIFLFAASGKGWIVRASVADRDAVRVKLGDRATVRLSAHPGVTFPAEVTEIAAAASAQTGTFDLELQIEAGTSAFLSGLAARVEIEPAQKEPVFFVPVEALVEGDGDRAGVYTLSGSTVRRVPVRTAFIDGDRVAIRDGLEGVEQVVTDGVAELSDGIAVRVVD